MLFEIKSWMDGSVLFSIETDSWRLAVEAGVKAKANLRSADLRLANLSLANLSLANLSLADLRSANLRSANLSSANLSLADLRSADLRSADLRSADLRSADLRSADLRSADLRSADLRLANLSSADLSLADLSLADLSLANLSSADLRLADGLELFPLSIAGHKHWLGTTQKGKLQIGCHTMSFDEWMAKAEEIGASEGYSPLDIEIYKLHIAHLQKVARLLWADKFPKESHE